MSANLAELLALAQAAVDAVAPGLAAPDARGDLGIDTKSSPTDMVTAMDRWAEETIVGVLLDARPDDGLLGEEGADKTSETGVIWVIDPIDGTTNFIRDLPGFSVSIAARVDGVDSVGVVHDLVRSERFTATLGSGAFCNGEAIHVSEPVDLARAVLGTGFNYQPTVRAEQPDSLRISCPTSPISAVSAAPIDCCGVASGPGRLLESASRTGTSCGRASREAGGRTLDHRPDGPSFVAPSPSSRNWSAAGSRRLISAAVPSGANLQASRAMGTRILTVEDDERIRTSVRLALEDEGWTVEAASGEDALAAFTREAADVVLIDIMLPGIDGYDVCRAIRRASDVPIVMVTRADTHDVVAGPKPVPTTASRSRSLPRALGSYRALLRRPERRPGTPMVFGDLEIIPEESVVRLAGTDVHLTKTEFRLWWNSPRTGAGAEREVLLERVWATAISATAAS